MNKPVVSDAEVQAYLTAQRAFVEEADRNFGRPNIGGLHTDTVPEACRAGLAAAALASRAAQPVDTSRLDCWQCRDAGLSNPICEPCNTGNRGGCLYKKRAAQPPTPQPQATVKVRLLTGKESLGPLLRGATNVQLSLLAKITRDTGIKFEIEGEEG